MICTFLLHLSIHLTSHLQTNHTMDMINIADSSLHLHFSPPVIYLFLLKLFPTPTFPSFQNCHQFCFPLFFFHAVRPSPTNCSSFVTSISLVGSTESRENSFSRSRSSSVSSIDRDTKEAITTLHFGESYGRKGDVVSTPCLWVGSSLGVVLLIPMSIPTDQEERMEEPVAIGPSGRSPEPEPKAGFYFVCSISCTAADTITDKIALRFATIALIPCLTNGCINESI